jgi:hypothetical protein
MVKFIYKVAISTQEEMLTRKRLRTHSCIPTVMPMKMQKKVRSIGKVLRIVLNKKDQ